MEGLMVDAVVVVAVAAADTVVPAIGAVLKDNGMELVGVEVAGGMGRGGAVCGGC